MNTVTKTRWRTAITEASAETVRIRGYDLSDLAEKVDFGAVFYLLSGGELPSPAAAKALNALMIAACDRGITPSSAITRTIASCGVPLQAAVAAGIISFGDIHGGVGIAMGHALKAQTDKLPANPAAAGGRRRGAFRGGFPRRRRTRAGIRPAASSAGRPAGAPPHRLRAEARRRGSRACRQAGGRGRARPHQGTFAADERRRSDRLRRARTSACRRTSSARSTSWRAPPACRPTLWRRRQRARFRLLATDDEVTYDGVAPRSL